MGNVPNFCRNASLIVNQTSYEQLSECWTEKRLADLLRTCLPLIILPISLLSNCLSFFALRTRHMRGTSTAFFMLVLSVLDPLVLITKNLLYFPTVFVSNTVSCKILYFLIYVLGYTNVWILVIMTADKFLAVWFPLKVSYFCTITRAKYICLLLLFLTSIISFHHFWTVGSLTHPQNAEQRYCSYDMIHYGFIQHIWRYVDFLIWCFFPFILILTLSVLIIHKLRQKSDHAQHRSNHRMQSDESKQNHSIESFEFFCSLLVSNITRSSRQRLISQTFQIRSTQKTHVIRSRHRHITLMLLAIASVFLLLTLPNSVYFVLDITYNFNQPPMENDYHQWLRYRRLTILTVIMFQISDFQHATNFFLYLLTSGKFRRAILKILARILPRFLICGCEEKRGFNRDTQLILDKNRHGASCFSSASDMSNFAQYSRYKSNQRHQPLRMSYKYYSVPSRLTTAMD